MKIRFLPQSQQYWSGSLHIAPWIIEFGHDIDLHILLIFVPKLNNLWFLPYQQHQAMTQNTIPIMEVSAPSGNVMIIKTVPCLTRLKSSLIIISPANYGFLHLFKSQLWISTLIQYLRYSLTMTFGLFT